MNNNEAAPPKRLDPLATRARNMLIAGSVLWAAGIIYSAVANLRWLSWVLERGWAVTLAAVFIALIVLFLLDTTRAKNVAWRSLCDQFSNGFEDALKQGNFATGVGQVGDFTYAGLRCFGSPTGLKISRIVKFVNPPLYIPWSAVTKVDTFPNLLTGRKDFETDMQARMTLSKLSATSFEVPWLTEYKQLLPKTVKCREIKLSKT